VEEAAAARRVPRIPPLIGWDENGKIIQISAQISILFLRGGDFAD
jgi:hypothetical protein